MVADGDRYDVAVVGGGLAGWMAATAAREQDRSVVVVERSRRRPGWGNSMLSGGALHAVLQDPRTAPDVLMARMTELTDGHSDPEVLRGWAENAARSIEWIESHGGDLMSDPTMSHRAKVFSPVRVTEPGTRYQGFGLPNFLTLLAGRFVAAGGAVAQPARAHALARADDGSWQLAVEGADGDISVAASAVVLADGGFQANRALMKRYVGTDLYRLRAAATGTGDGLRMGLSAGGVAVNMNGFYGHLLAREALHDNDLWPYPILDGLGTIGVVVGPDGARIVDEADSGVTTTNAIAWAEDPLGYWLVFDDDAWTGEGRGGVTPPNPHLLDHDATVLTEDSLEALAGRAGIDPSGLLATVKAVLDDPSAASPPRQGSVKLQRAPFHAVPLVAGVTFTFGGLRVDARARVLDADGAAIDGLYAAGGTMGGLHGGPRVGYAGGLLEAAVYGMLAGEDAGAYRS